MGSRRCCGRVSRGAFTFLGSQQGHWGYGTIKGMTNILILGGTAWLGREITQQFLRRGASVTCLARGDSGSPPTGVTFVRADRSQPDAYDAVRGQRWDDVVELSYDNLFVTGALHALSGQAEHWTLISSVSVYASNSEIDADESAELYGPTDLSNYGHAKVAAELVSLDVLGGRLLIARPGLIAGAGDPSGRFGYWLARFALAQTEAVLSASTAGRFVQIIDVLDLASWIADAAVNGRTGTINAVGNPVRLAEFLRQAADVAGYSGQIVEADDDWLQSHGVTYWTGPDSLPLWLPTNDSAFAQRSNDRFVKSGGDLRPIQETLKATLDDEQSRGLSRVRRAGITRDRERDLLAQLEPR